MTHNTAVKVSELLDGAADYIEKNGLHKGWYFKGFDGDDELLTHERAHVLLEEGKTPPCCTFGALVMAGAKAGYAYYVLSDEGVKAALRQAGVDWWDIPDWNDKPSQRKSRVVATLRKAAEFARKENK